MFLTAQWYPIEDLKPSGFRAMPFRLDRALARAIAVALIASVANITTTQLAWRFDELTISRSLETIGEVYLDGLVASIKEPVAQDKPGEVDRRLKSEFTEQNGIAEKLIVILDGKGSITNIVGRKSLATESVLAVTPGSPRLDRETNLLVTARQFGTSRAIAVLDVAPIRSKFDRTAQFIALLSLLVAAVAGLVTFFLMQPRAVDADGASATSRADAARAV